MSSAEPAGEPPGGEATAPPRRIRPDPELAARRNLIAAAWVTASATLFALTGALVKLAGELGTPVAEIVFARVLIGFLAILPFAWRQRARIRRPSKMPVHLARATAGCIAIFSGFYALTVLPLAEFTALAFTQALFTTILAVALLGESVGWRRWSAVAIGFLGVLVALRPDTGSVGHAALLALLMPLGIATAVTLVKRLPPEESPPVMLFWFSVFTLPIMAVPAFAVWQTPSAEQAWVLLAIGLVGVGSQVCNLKAFKLGQASFLAPFDYVKLPIAGLTGYFLFAEVPTLWTLAGAAIIVASTLYIGRREARARRAR